MRRDNPIRTLAGTKKPPRGGGFWERKERLLSLSELMIELEDAR